MLLFSMDLSKNQSKLGDLKTKTTQEIEEVIKREKKLLSNVKFVGKLPDKGQKVKHLIQLLESELKGRAEVESTADLFHQMVLNAEQANRERGVNPDEPDENTEESTFKNIINTGSNEKMVVDYRGTEPNTYINSYEKIIKNNKNKGDKKKFYPHRTVKSQSVSELSKDISIRKDVVRLDNSATTLANSTQQPKEDLMNTNVVHILPETLPENGSLISEPHSFAGTNLGLKSENPKLKHRYDDSLEKSVYTPSKAYGGTKLISIEDSIEIYEAHKKKQELVQAQHAGRKLAEKLGVKMTEFEPKQMEMRYRDPNENSSDESDSSDKEVDYPD